MVLSFEMANNHSSLTKFIPNQPQIVSIKYEHTSVQGQKRYRLRNFAPDGCDYVVKKTVESTGQGSRGGEASA